MIIFYKKYSSVIIKKNPDLKNDNSIILCCGYITPYDVANQGCYSFTIQGTTYEIASCAPIHV